MKVTFRNVALFMLLVVAAAGCQKENLVETDGIGQTVQIVHMVNYSVDGVPMQVVLYGESDWTEFLARMVVLARCGHQIVILNNANNTQSPATKTTVVYTTWDENDAIQWSQKMLNDGYSVTITFDEKSGQYICTAIKE